MDIGAFFENDEDGWYLHLYNSDELIAGETSVVNAAFTWGDYSTSTQLTFHYITVDLPEITWNLAPEMVVDATYTASVELSNYDWAPEYFLHYDVWDEPETFDRWRDWDEPCYTFNMKENQVGVYFGNVHLHASNMFIWGPRCSFIFKAQEEDTYVSNVTQPNCVTCDVNRISVYVPGASEVSLYHDGNPDDKWYNEDGPAARWHFYPGTAGDYNFTLSACIDGQWQDIDSVTISVEALYGEIPFQGLEISSGFDAEGNLEITWNGLDDIPVNSLDIWIGEEENGTGVWHASGNGDEVRSVVIPSIAPENNGEFWETYREAGETTLEYGTIYHVSFLSRHLDITKEHLRRPSCWMMVPRRILF